MGWGKGCRGDGGEEGRKGKMMREKDGAVQEGDKNGGEGEEEGREE